DRKAIAPMRIRHRVGGIDDPRQAGDIADLLQDLVVHVGDQWLAAVEHRGHAHGALRLKTPLGRGDSQQTRKVHASLLSQTSTTHWAIQAPSFPLSTLSDVRVAPFGSTA